MGRDHDVSRMMATYPDPQIQEELRLMSVRPDSSEKNSLHVGASMNEGGVYGHTWIEVLLLAGHGSGFVVVTR